MCICMWEVISLNKVIFFGPNKCPLCCGVVKMESVKHHVSMHGMFSATLIVSNYVRYDAEIPPDH